MPDTEQPADATDEQQVEQSAPAAAHVEDQPRMLYGHRERLINPSQINMFEAHVTMNRLVAGTSRGFFAGVDSAVLMRYALIVALLQEDARDGREIDHGLVEDLCLLADMLGISPRAREMVASARDLADKGAALSRLLKN